MLHGLSNPAGVGSELTHLLARLAQTAAAPSGHRPPDKRPEQRPEQRPVFAERLGHWLGWKGAISLSAALQAAAGEGDPGHGGLPGRGRIASTVREEADFHRVRAALEASIDAGPREDASSPTDFGPYRRHCLQQQQAMQDAIGALRQRLRAALSRHSPAMARLSGIDAVMDQTLATQERGLLGLVPVRLQAHFESLQRAAAAESAWLESFRLDMALLLHAECRHRLLPARGLLDTLMTLSQP
jgi:hypothetical protein